METRDVGERVKVATGGPEVDGLVFDTPSAHKVVVAIVDPSRGPVFRTVAPEALSERAEDGPHDKALRSADQADAAASAMALPAVAPAASGGRSGHNRPSDTPHRRPVMAAYSIARREDATDFMADWPEYGEQRWFTEAVGAEQVSFSWRRMLPGTGGRGSYGHRHPGHEELYFVFSGIVTFKLGDDVFEAGPQTAVRVAGDTFRLAPQRQGHRGPAPDLLDPARRAAVREAGRLLAVGSRARLGSS